MGLFHAFVGDAGVQLHGVEAAGEGIATGRHAATLVRRARRRAARLEVVTCSPTTTGRSCRRTRSRPGLDYPGVGPEHAWLEAVGPRALRRRSPTTRRSRAAAAGAHRGHPVRARDGARHRLSAAAGAARCPTAQSIVVALSGRGDKDMATVAQALGVELVNRLVARMARARGASARRRSSSTSPRAIRRWPRRRRCSREIARAGADVIELGVPWSDPSADGAGHPARHGARARRRAAPATTRWQDARRWCARSAASRTCRSCSSATTTRSCSAASARVAGEARDAGVDGMLVVDLPPEESDELDGALAPPACRACRCWRRRPRPSARAPIVARGVGLRLLRRAHRRHRRRPPRRRRGRPPRRRAAPVARRRCRWRSASACATRRARARWRRTCDAVVVGSALVQAIAAAPDAAARRKVAYERVRALKDGARRRLASSR